MSEAKRYCRDCRYPARGWSTNACPECGCTRTRTWFPRPRVWLTVALIGVVLVAYQAVIVEIDPARQSYQAAIQTFAGGSIAIEFTTYLLPFVVGAMLVSAGTINLLRKA